MEVDSSGIQIIAKRRYTVNLKPSELFQKLEEYLCQPEMGGGPATRKWIPVPRKMTGHGEFQLNLFPMYLLMRRPAIDRERPFPSLKEINKLDREFLGSYFKKSREVLKNLSHDVPFHLEVLVVEEDQSRSVCETMCRPVLHERIRKGLVSEKDVPEYKRRDSYDASLRFLDEVFVGKLRAKRTTDVPPAGPKNDRSMKIKVVPAVRGGSALELDVPSTATVGAIKRTVCVSKGLPPDTTKLTYKGRPLKDTDVLFELGVKEGDKMVLLTRVVSYEEFVREKEKVRALERARHVGVAKGFTDLFTRFPDIEWDAELVEKVGRLINAGMSDSDLFDSAMQVMTKLIESRLRSEVSEFASGEVIPEKSYGMKLVDFAKEIGFIKRKGSEPEPLYYLLRWYLLELRNASHHLFKDYPVSALTTNLTITNYLLREIEYRARRPKPLYIPIEFDKSEYAIGETINFESPIVQINGKPLVKGLVKAHIVFPPGVERTIDTMHVGSGRWTSSITTVGNQPGTVTVSVEATDESGQCYACSGAVLVLSKPGGSASPRSIYGAPNHS